MSRTSPSTCTISVTISDDPVTILFVILLIDYLTISLPLKWGMPLTVSPWDYSHVMETLCSKAYHDNYSQPFFIFTTECQYTIITSYALLTNDILFWQSFLQSQTNISCFQTFSLLLYIWPSKRFSWLFSLLLVNSIYLCFPVSPPSIVSTPRLNNTITNIIIPPRLYVLLGLLSIHHTCL